MEAKETFENTWIKSETISDEEYVDEPDFIKTLNQVGASSSDHLGLFVKVSKTSPKSVNGKTKSKTPVKSKTPRKTFECQACLKSFKTSKELVVHTRVHTNERPFKCDVCEKAFKQRGALIDHRKTHTGERKYACKICDGRFSTSSCVKRHMVRLHKEQKEFPCPLCPDAFQSKSQYLRHRETHFQALNISCEEVLKELKSSHSCTCKVCEKKFRKRAHLFMHLDIHSTPISCQHCNKKFTYAALKIHCKKLHQLTECSICNKVFSNNQAKAKHERLHFKLPSDTCDYCVQIFETDELLQEHMRNVHSNTIPCPFCVKIFCDNHLDYHVTFAHFKCFKCKLYFPNKEEKVIHYKYKHLPYGIFKYTCKKCKAKFLTKSRLAYHMNSVHLIVTAFTCAYCGKHFKRYRLLERHLLDNHRPFLRQKIEGKKGKQDGLYDTRKRKPPKPTQCEICCKNGEEKYYRTKKLLHAHIAERHSKSVLKLLPESVQCEQCDETFLNIHKLNMHLRETHKSTLDNQDSTRTCKECLISFLDATTLREHFLAIHQPQLRDIGNNYCLHCPYKARYKKDLIRHMHRRHRTHLPVLVRRKLDLQLKPCPECDREFDTATALKRHMAKHQRPKLNCPLCGKQFNNKGGMSTHIRRKTCTTNGAIKSCPYCPYRSKGKLLRHMYHQHRDNLPENVVHNFDVRKVPCPICGHKFEYKALLKKHMAVHLKSPDMSCPRCGKEFTRRSGLGTHIRTCTLRAIKKYECAHCEELFTKKSELSFHVQSKHDAFKITKEMVKTETIEEEIDIHEEKIKDEIEKDDELLCCIEIKNENVAACD